MLEFYFDDADEVDKLFSSLTDNNGKYCELLAIFKLCSFQNLLHEYGYCLTKNILVKDKLEILKTKVEDSKVPITQMDIDFLNKLDSVSSDICETLLQELHIFPNIVKYYKENKIDIYTIYVKYEKYKEDSILYYDWVLRHALYIKTIKDILEFGQTEFEIHCNLEELLMKTFHKHSKFVVSEKYLSEKSTDLQDWIDEITFWNNSFISTHLGDESKLLLSREIKCIFEYILTNDVVDIAFRDTISKVLYFLNSIKDKDAECVTIFKDYALRVVRENRWTTKICEKIDPIAPVKDQSFCVVSLKPSKYAIPDETGVYGNFCVYGSFPSLESAEDYCKSNVTNSSASVLRIIKNRCSVPFTIDKKFTDQSGIIHLPKSIDDQKCVNEHSSANQDLSAEKRAHNLTLDSKISVSSPIEKYLKERQTLGTTSYFITLYKSKIEEFTRQYEISLAKAKKMELKHPHVKKEYMKHYNSVVAQTGLDKCDDAMATYIKNHIGNEI